jgi:hypothetical protein
MGPNQYLVPFTQRSQAPRAPLTASPDVFNPGGGYYNISTIWRDKSTNDFYILVDIENNLGHWEKFTGGSGTTVTISDTTGTKVDPDGTGNIQLFGATNNVIVTADVPNNRLILSLPVGLSGQILVADGVGGYIPTTLPIGSLNLGLTLAAGVFTVTSRNGTALSATNPAYITVERKAPNGGLNTQYVVTSNSSFVDASGGAPTLTQTLFGTLNTDLWNQDMPFYLYAVASTSESDVQFMISRDPSAKVSSATIGRSGLVTALGQYDFWAMNPAITVANYTSQPCTVLGAFRMRKTATAGSWTVQAFTQADGIGNFHESTWFTMPTGIFGATAASHWTNNGGTQPANTPSYYVYKLLRDGFVDHEYETQLTGNGAGAVSATITIPFAYVIPGSVGFGMINGIGFFIDASAGLTINITPVRVPTQAAGNTMIFNYQSSTPTIMQYQTLQTSDVIAFKFRSKLY